MHLVACICYTSLKIASIGVFTGALRQGHVGPSGTRHRDKMRNIGRMEMIFWLRCIRISRGSCCWGFAIFPMLWEVPDQREPTIEWLNLAQIRWNFPSSRPSKANFEGQVQWIWLIWLLPIDIPTYHWYSPIDSDRDAYRYYLCQL